MKTFVIAEAGANHNRNFEQAKALIHTAKSAGATAVKFQTYSADTLYSSDTPDFAGYTNINELIKSIELPREWQKDLKEYCDTQEIEFMSTPFDEQAVDELIQIGVKRLKIAGFESTDWRFVEMVASAGLPLIISLGIGFDLEWKEKLIQIASKYTNDITLLHCNNAYPTPMEDIDLNKVKMLSGDKRYKTGLSDHTLSTLTPALAVATGASVIEKHFTLSRNLPGPDHPFALEPAELKEMIYLISEAEKAFISHHQEYTDSERSFIKARRSVVAKVNIQSGSILTEENITTKRPFLNNSIPASHFYDLIGTKVAENIKANTIIDKNFIC
jgi:sialic acid synthase SpsE